MAQRRTIFGNVQRVDASRSALSTLRESSVPVTVHFERGEVATITGTAEQTQIYASIFEDSRKAQIPVCAIVDEDTNHLVELFIPLPSDMVTSLSADGEETVEVQLRRSAAPHYLKRTDPNFQHHHDVLADALQRGSGVVVTENDDHEIIDVQAAPRPFVREDGLRESTARSAPRRDLPAMTMGEAKELFELVSGKTCDAKNPTSPCIPFLFPRDGCYARAHEMCRLIDPAKTGKVLSYGKLVAKTKNDPGCEVRWVYHVAPTVAVEGGSGTAMLVLDPSLFAHPVTIAAWISEQGDPHAKQAETDATPFYRSPDGSIDIDPDYSDTNSVLERHRLDLKRQYAKNGAPPYAQCSVIS